MFVEVDLTEKCNSLQMSPLDVGSSHPEGGNNNYVRVRRSEQEVGQPDAHHIFRELITLTEPWNETANIEKSN